MKSLAKALEVSKSAWNRIGKFAIGWIRADASKGMMQDGKKYSYKSQSYAKYRASKGRQTSFVDMNLTGETLNQIKPKATKDGVEIVFNRGEVVEENEKRGYVLNDLTDENLDKLANKYADELDPGIREWAREKITFKIGR